MATLKLQASDGNVLLIVGMDFHNGECWGCNVFLEKEKKYIKLGEGGFKQIRSQILSHLRAPYATKKAVFGSREADYFWVFNLMGPHAAIYGLPVREEGSDGSGAIKWVDLLWDKDIDQPIMRLNEKDIQSWFKILEETEQLPEEK